MIQRYGYLSEDYNKFNCIGTIFMYWNGWGAVVNQIIRVAQTAQN